MIKPPTRDSGAQATSAKSGPDVWEKIFAWLSNAVDWASEALAPVFSKICDILKGCFTVPAAVVSHLASPDTPSAPVLTDARAQGLLNQQGNEPITGAGGLNSLPVGRRNGAITRY